MEKDDQILLTILTATYNRAHTLPACYESLEAQTRKSFEWVVVDDGSIDNTEHFFASLESASFPIRYIKKKNGGKHTALNEAHPYIRGRFVLMLDSDDTLTPDAVDQVVSTWAKYENDFSIGIVTFLKGCDPDHPNCYAADEGVPVDIMSYHRICTISSDACEVIRRELFLKYPFPVFPGEKFVSEGALWNRVSFTHQCIYINRVIYLCSYLEDGLTKSGRSLRIRNPRGGMFTANLNMAKKNDWKRRIKNGLLFTCYGCFAGLSPQQMAEYCNYRTLMFICLPFGWLVYLYWKMKYQ